MQALEKITSERRREIDQELEHVQHDDDTLSVGKFWLSVISILSNCGRLEYVKGLRPTKRC